jgi:hypothetical protein
MTMFVFGLLPSSNSTRPDKKIGIGIREFSGMLVVPNVPRLFPGAFEPGVLLGVVGLVVGPFGVVEVLEPAPVLPRCANAPGIAKIVSARGRNRRDCNHDDLFGPIGTSR